MYQPFRPGVPVTMGLIAGDVVSATSCSVAPAERLPSEDDAFTVNEKLPVEVAPGWIESGLPPDIGNAAAVYVASAGSPFTDKDVGPGSAAVDPGVTALVTWKGTAKPARYPVALAGEIETLKSKMCRSSGADRVAPATVAVTAAA